VGKKGPTMAAERTSVKSRSCLSLLHVLVGRLKSTDVCPPLASTARRIASCLLSRFGVEEDSACRSSATKLPSTLRTTITSDLNMGS
jgi:hypothetical protein